mmetsp:Transcript_3416/g.10438  ORF Transcript_3416/g.10438 Transcript_3416/m.10438 type:complete len:221 (+) Transcript_3416:552-1214(+)
MVALSLAKFPPPVRRNPLVGSSLPLLDRRSSDPMALLDPQNRKLFRLATPLSEPGVLGSSSPRVITRTWFPSSSFSNVSETIPVFFRLYIRRGILVVSTTDGRRRGVGLIAVLGSSAAAHGTATWRRTGLSSGIDPAGARTSPSHERLPSRYSLPSPGASCAPAVGSLACDSSSSHELTAPWSSSRKLKWPGFLAAQIRNFSRVSPWSFAKPRSAQASLA